MTTAKTTLGSKVAFGEESAWGTEVARSWTVRLSSMSGGRAATHVQPPHLVADDNDQGLVRGTQFLASERCVVTYRAVAAYSGNGLGGFLKHALGAISSSGSGPYDHTYTLSKTRQTGLSAENILGNSAKSFESYGGKIRSIRITCESAKVAEVEVEVVYKQGAARASLGTIPALQASYPIKHSHGGTLGWNSGTWSISRFTLSVSFSLSEEQEIGSTTVSEPVVADYADISMEVEALYDGTDTLEAGHIAGTNSNAAITFTDSTNSMTMVVTVQNAYIDSYTMPLDGPGVLRQTVRFRPKSESSEPGVTVALTGIADSAGLY